MKIGFLFNHDQIHQVAHSLPIALPLLDRHGVDVVLAATNARLSEEVQRVAALFGETDLPLVELDLASASSRTLNGALGWAIPSRKLLIYRDNLSFFAQLDALVVSERTSLLLKRRYGMHDLPILLADHGAGDRAIGFGAEARHFDLILAAGRKIADRLIKDAGVPSSRIAITGYPKFDLPRASSLRLPFPDRSRPTVLYNPHVSPHLSSWYKMGRQVLDFFLASERYNLIFAPHVMMFERRWALSIDKLRLARPGSIDARHMFASNIHVDLGSPASTDMSYTNAADIYLGDVSSQIYEFLRWPRPAVFLNAHDVQYQGDPNYAHWNAGPVISTVESLEGALRRASEQRHQFAPVQQALFRYTFDMNGERSGDRAARAIMDFLSKDARRIPEDLAFA